QGGLLAPPLVEFPREKLALRLVVRFAEQGRSKADAVEIRGRFRADDFSECGEKIAEVGDMCGHLACLDLSRPARDERHAYSALVKVALDPAQSATRVEELRIVAALFVRPVVAAEEDQRLIVEAEILDQGKQPTDVRIHPR